MTTMIAKRNSKGNLSLMVDGVYFGSIYLRADGSVIGGSFVEDAVNESFKRLRMPTDTLQQILARARRAYELVASYEEWTDSIGMGVQQPDDFHIGIRG